MVVACPAVAFFWQQRIYDYPFTIRVFLPFAVMAIGWVSVWGVDDEKHQSSSFPRLSQRGRHHRRTSSITGRGGGDPSTADLSVNC